MTHSIVKSFVNGRALGSQDPGCFPVVNPATGQTCYQVESADETVLTAAIESASKAFIQWSAMPVMERCRILLRAADILRSRNDLLAEIEVRDTGKPWREASTVDVATGADVLEYYAGLAPTVVGTQQPVGDDFFYTRREPLGVCLGIGAWNYPLQIACWKAAPALACGNTMIFKPSEETPLGAVKLAEIFIEAGMPLGVFNVVQGGPAVGQYLTHHEAIAKVSFTGQVSTGKQVMSAAAKTLKGATMELGGKSPLILFNDVDLDEAVNAAMLANFYTQGEVCTNGTRVFVQRDIYQAFLDKLAQATRDRIKIGDPMNPETNMGALINQAHLDKVLGYIEQGKREGAKLLTGGDRAYPTDAPGGYFVQPTIFYDCKDDMKITQEEIFGPVMSVMSFETEDEVISRANNTSLGLAAGVYTRDLRRAHRVIHQLKAGICWINAYGASPAEMPVGGYKESGVGRENGLETINHYTQTKSVYVGLTETENPF